MSKDDAKPTQRQLDEGLWNAAKDGDLDKCKELRAAGANPKWVHPHEPPGRAYQWTALHVASDNGRVDVVKWLGDKGGADINQKCAYGETALQHVDGRKGNGREAVQAYLKVKTGMMAVMAAQKFAASQKKPSAAGGMAAALSAS